MRNSKVFITDCEGPISKNDNAFEITAHFLPKGDYFFSILSKYDDVLADIVKRPEYRAGNTLKLITPFLKAYGVTNTKVKKFSSENIILIRGSKDLLRRIKDMIPSFIVSTSYEQYISSICRLTEFPFQNVYCTKLDLDKYSISGREVARLKQLQEEISTLPMIEIPRGVTSINQMSTKHLEVIKTLNKIFWEEIPQLNMGRMIEEIRPIGGVEKANAIRDIIERVDCVPRNIMYVGDSITDVEGLQMVRKADGLAVSFNGNEYAILNAEVAILSQNAVITLVLADVFAKYGKETVIRLVEEGIYPALRKYCSDKKLIQAVSNAYLESSPKVELVTGENMDRLIEESSSFRKNVRGEAIGRLG